jgi:hypothetical protein
VRDQERRVVRTVTIIASYAILAAGVLPATAAPMYRQDYVIFLRGVDGKIAFLR